MIALILNFTLIPSFGIVGAASATVIAYAVALMATAIYASRIFSFTTDWKFLIKTIIASALMSIIISSFSVRGAIQTVLAVAGGAVLYMVFMLVMKSFGQKEKEFFFAFFKNRAKTIKEPI